jgi:hypothetical protein
MWLATAPSAPQSWGVEPLDPPPPSLPRSATNNQLTHELRIRQSTQTTTPAVHFRLGSCHPRFSRVVEFSWNSVLAGGRQIFIFQLAQVRTRSRSTEWVPVPQPAPSKVAHLSNCSGLNRLLKSGHWYLGCWGTPLALPRFFGVASDKPHPSHTTRLDSTRPPSELLH